jgi:hypothetical protein
VYTSNFTVSAGMSSTGYLIDASNGSITVTLPDATIYEGDHFYLKRADSKILNTVTINPVQNQTIDNSTSKSLISLASFHIMSRNGAWWILSNT